MQRPDTYYRLIEEAAANRTDVIISNSRAEHAMYAIATFLRLAVRTVRIYSGRLARELDHTKVYEAPDLMDGAYSLLTRPGCELRVVVQDELDGGEDHGLVAMVRDMKDKGTLRGALVVKKASKQATEFLRDRDYDCHWQVMDHNAYRLEHDPDNASAHINFGTQKVAEALAELFDSRLWTDGHQLLEVR